MDEKKKLRAQTEQSDANASLKWKDAEHRMEEVESRMEEMKKLLATETMLRKKADRTVKFLRAQLVQAKKDVEDMEKQMKQSIKKETAATNDTYSRPLSAKSRPSSGGSQRSLSSQGATSESESSTTKSGDRPR